MRIVEINAYNFGSTGNIMLQIAEAAKNKGHQVYTCCPSSKSNSRRKNIPYQIFIGTRFTRNLHVLLGYITGLNECFSMVSTYRFLRKMDKIKPDIIHLHNLHGAYINVPMLFRYIKRNNIKTIWTLHDCWSFTGGCPHFTLARCQKWKTGCHHCPSYREYPGTSIDSTKRLYKLKQCWFSGVKDLTIVTPSQWLADLVGESFLKEYSVKVIHNGIDLSVFKPTESDFRAKYNISETKKILLGVAFGWGIKKGLDIFIELTKRLDQDKYQIVLVGTSDDTDKQLPANIISIHRTQNQAELAEIYTAADLFVNPTREEVLGLVNLEALACGTPVVTFRTGGSPECLDETCGSVVGYDDIDALEKEIVRICDDIPYSRDMCLQRAESFNINKTFQMCVELY